MQQVGQFVAGVIVLVRVCEGTQPLFVAALSKQANQYLGGVSSVDSGAQDVLCPVEVFTLPEQVGEFYGSVSVSSVGPGVQDLCRPAKVAARYE